MRVKKAMKFVAAVLATSMVITTVEPAAVAYAQQPEKVLAQTTEAKAGYVLQNGTVVLNGKEDIETVKVKLAQALISDYSEEMDLGAIEFEYYCEGKSSLGLKNTAWGSVNGFESQTGSLIKTTYKHQALKDNTDGNYQVRLAGTEGEVTVVKTQPYADIVVNENASVSLVFNEDATVDYNAVRQAVLDTVIADSTPELTVDNTTIEYYATAKTGAVGALGKAWMPLEGGKKDLLDYPAIPAGQQKIKITFNGDDEYTAVSKEVTVTIMERAEAVIEVAENPEIGLTFNDDLSVDYDAVRQAVLSNVVTSSTPELTADNTTIEYYATAKTGAVGELGKAWMPLEGGKKDLLDYPAMETGSQKIRISYNGSKDYLKTSVEVIVNVTERPEADFVLAEGQDVKLVYDDELNVDYQGLYSEIFDKVVALGEKELTLEDVTIEYYAAPKTNINEAGKQWMPLEGGSYKVPVLGFDVEFEAIKEGTRTIRVSYAGDKETAPTTREVDITVTGRPEVEVKLNEAPYEVGLVFNEEQSYNYEATAEAIVKAVIASTTPEIPYENFVVAYNADVTGLVDSWKPLNNTDITNLKKFGAGNWKIRISWTGTKDYKDGNVVVNVTTTDSRTETTVAIKGGATFTYNPDVNVMKEEILNQVIDWDNSTLPARETVNADDFELQYKTLPSLGTMDKILGIAQGNATVEKILKVLEMYVPIEGALYGVKDIPGAGPLLALIPGMADLDVIAYDHIGAGNQQDVAITYKGDAEYRPSETVETKVDVAKAKAKVNVKWTNIFAGQPMPEDFVTINPVDKFDVYTVFVGLSSSASLGIYVDLPEVFTDGAIMKAIDPIVNSIFGKTLTQMLNDGMTVGELRKMFAAEEFLNMLETLGVDTGAFGQILQVLDSVAGIVDGIRVAFGTPDRAGLYSAVAITDSKNYETAVGFGTILVRFNSKGVKLNWNQAINGSLTAAQAQEFDFGATLSQDGDVTIDQSSVSYLYTGLTSKFRLYSSTTTPPTEPGSYVVTVVTLGGNYITTPITRTFRITK